MALPKRCTKVTVPHWPPLIPSSRPRRRCQEKSVLRMRAGQWSRVGAGDKCPRVEPMRRPETVRRFPGAPEEHGAIVGVRRSWNESRASSRPAPERDLGRESEVAVTVSRTPGAARLLARDVRVSRIRPTGPFLARDPTSRALRQALTFAPA
jgi:hypothetical protein